MNELQIRQMQISRAKDEIRCCNELNQIYGLTLTEADITELVELRGQALRSTGRVEFGGGILPKLIRAFCKSPYVDPYNYAAIRVVRVKTKWMVLYAANFKSQLSNLGRKAVKKKLEIRLEMCYN